VKVLRLPVDDARGIRRWARSVFLYSLVYLTVLFAALGLDRVLRLRW
jgi:heme O synthase-like polyprenyltransferase